jgi:hypothetical protein
MNPEQIKSLVKKSIIMTRHAQEKAEKENISKKDIENALLSGLESKVDMSTRNDKSFAWNNRPHNTITTQDLTVVFCESLERACLILSVYHGKPHDYLSNPYNKPALGRTTQTFRTSSLKIFR